MTTLFVISVVFIGMLLTCWRCFIDSSTISKLFNSISKKLQKNTQPEYVPSIKELIVQLQRLNGQKSLYGVWLDLVEAHWDYVASSSQRDEPNTFARQREMKFKTKKAIDADVADLALNYWQRNRFRLRESFINWCWFMSRNAAKYQILKAASADDAIPCFDDPVIKGRRSRFDVDVEWIDIHMPSYFQQRKTEWLKAHNLI